jgi:hypothetical protein
MVKSVLKQNDFLSGHSINKTDRHDITDILLKVALKTITPLFNNYPWDLDNK